MRKAIPTYSFENTSKIDCMADVFLWGKQNGYKFDELHSHTFHELLFFEQGRGEHFMGYRDFEITPHSVHILPASFTHQLKRSPDSEGFTIAFSHDFIGKLQKVFKNSKYTYLIYQPRIIQFDTKFVQELQPYLEELKNTKLKDAYFLNLVSLVLLKIIRYFATKEEQGEDKRFELSVIVLLNEHFRQRRDNTFYSRQLGISTTQMYHLCTKHFGKSILALQNEKVLAEVKFLLSQGYSQKEIAYAHSFYDAKHLRRFFKTHTGESIQDYLSQF